MYKRILLAYDGSREGLVALREGALLAKRQGARVFLLSVQNVALMTAAGLVTVLTVPIAVAEAIYRLTSPRAQYWYRIMVVLPVVMEL